MTDEQYIKKTSTELNRLKKIYSVHTCWDLNQIGYLIHLLEKKNPTNIHLPAFRQKLSYQKTLPLPRNRWIWAHTEIETLLEQLQ